MGVDVAARSPSRAALFDRAAEVLGYDLLALQNDGPEEKLRETQFSQPAIFATNVALYSAVGEAFRAGRQRGPLVRRVLQSRTPRGRSTFEDALRS